MSLPQAKAVRTLDDELGEYPLPDHTQLPETDGTFVKNFQEHPQSILLTDSIEPVLEQRHPDGQFCIGQDSGIYWRLTEPRERGAVSPDWFYVPDVPRMLEGEFRRSYVLWQEYVAPLIVIEFVSGDGSEERDRTPITGKFWIYERAIRVPYYVIFDGWRAQVEAYRLVDGWYQPVAPDERGHSLIEPMELAVGIWHGNYRGMQAPWLRWWAMDGSMLPTSDERAEHERERAEHERERAEHERERAEHEHERAERLAAQLREMGIDPDA